MVGVLIFELKWGEKMDIENELLFESKLVFAGYRFYKDNVKYRYVAIKGRIYVSIAYHEVDGYGAEKAFEIVEEIHAEIMSESKLKGLNLTGAYFDEFIEHKNRYEN